MADWMAAAELAALKMSASDLKALEMRKWPETPRGINKRAQAAGWEGRKVDATQAWEYRVAALPAPVQRAIARTLVKIVPPPMPAQLDLPLVTDLKDHQRTRMDARAALLGQIDALVMTGLSRGRAVDALVAAASAGDLPPELQKLVPVANARPSGTRTLTRATVYNWLKARATAGAVVALAPKAVPEAPLPSWARDFMDLYCRPTNPGIAECLDRWPEGVERPSYDQVRRFLKRLDAVTRHTGRKGPKALAQMKAYVSRDVSELWPGAVFVGDGHTFKAEIAHPAHGRPFRPEVTSFIDVYTRRWVGWSVALAENTWSVADALRHAVTATTCCDIVYYDNGSGAKNRTWDDQICGLIARLGITKMHSAPWNSQARGVVEHFHATVMHTAARWLPTYIGQRLDEEAGHKLYRATRRDLALTGTSRLMPSWRLFADYIDETMAVYNDRPHSALPKIVDATGHRRHMSPNEAWATAIAAGWAPTPIDADDAIDLFRPEEIRRTARGLVQLHGNSYYHTDLQHLHDEKVRVRYDIHDASRVWVFLLDGRFVCAAEWNAHKKSYVPVSLAVQAREKRVAAALARLQVHQDTSLAELTPNIAMKSPEAAPISAIEAARIAAMEAEWEELPSVDEIEIATQIEVPLTIEARFRRVLDIRARIAAGGYVSDMDRAWLQRQERLPDIRAHQRLFENFGDAALTA